MPPEPYEYQGQAAIAAFLHHQAALRGAPLRRATASSRSRSVGSNGNVGYWNPGASRVTREPGSASDVYWAGRSRARTVPSWAGSIGGTSWSEGIDDGLAFSNSLRLRARGARSGYSSPAACRSWPVTRTGAGS
jgi:hypothetical protein